MSNCKDCTGGCSSGCGNCGKTLELTQGELHILEILAQYSFLPVARAAGDDLPIYREDHDYTQEEYSLILACLEKKALIELDYSIPLLGADMSAYRDLPIHGCIALTLRGQQVLELIETQGLE